MRLPNDSHRTTIVGKTGSGKTVAGVWHLSKRAYDKMPWIVLDYKRDKLIARLPATEISVTDKVPDKPGIYILRPHITDDDEVEAFLWKMWQRGNVGLYVDEGYMLPYGGKSEALSAILTQGRSLKIPTIILSQRPVWLSRFVISEADFLQVFWLSDIRDRKTLTGVMPPQVLERVGKYHSNYYDVGDDKLVTLSPVPNEDIIVASFKDVREKKKLLWF